ncbi:unnamed protein product [Peniophora sp. CBMAI 1063]|nr:unnamed protein product [Peniophora sp. CBMAI 1063]
MPSPQRVRFNTEPVLSEYANEASPAPDRDVDLMDYGVPSDDVDVHAEHTLPPANPAHVAREGNHTDFHYIRYPNSTFALHSSLATFPRDAIVNGASAFTHPDQAATVPHAQKVVVRGLPWPLRVAPTGDFSHVTLRNVVDSLCAFLKGAASGDDFASAANPEAVSRTFYTRTRRNQALREAGILRLDFIPGPIVGLESIVGEDGAFFQLIFGDAV